MKKLLQYITLFCSACIPAALGSCSSDLSSGDVTYSATGVGGEVDLSLNVRIGNTTGVRPTRDGEESDDKFSFEPSDDEYELIKTLRVIIVRADNTVEYNRTILLGKAAEKLSPEDETSLENDLKFRVSTDLGRVDTEAMTSTETKRIYLIANEAALDNFKSNMAGEGQKITEILDGIKPAHYLSTQEEGKEETRHRGDRLDPFSVEKWIIYNEWPGGVDTPGEMAVPIIDNTGEDDTKSYIPMTEYFDVDVVSTWKPADKADGEEGTNDESVVNIAKQNLDLFVTRNFVKFQFSAYSDTEAFDITAIRFYKLMQKEYLFPFNTVYDPPKAINNTEDRQIISFQTPGFADNRLRPYIFKHEHDSPLISYTPRKTEGETGGNTEGETGEEPEVKIEPVVYSPALYFCETHNIISTETNLQQFKVGIDVTYKKLKADGTYEALDSVSYGATPDDAVQLQNLPYSLPRNTIVKVDMRLKDRKLAAVATVFPYTAVNLNPEFGFAPPVTDRLTIAPTMELQLNGEDGLLYPTFTSEKENTIQNLYWVSSNPSVILLGNEVTDETDQRYIEPSGSIELPYLQEIQDKKEPVPVRVIPQGTGTANVTVYTQSGLVARCRVTVK